MKLLHIFILLILIHSSLIGQQFEVFPKQIVIEKDCNEEIINGVLELWSLPSLPINIFNLRSDLCEIEFYSNGNKINKRDTLTTASKEKLKIEFRFKNYTEVNTEISFSTRHKKENVVQINLGSFNISHEEIKSGTTKNINVKNNCSDSIRVYFPKGGTVTGVTVHTNEFDMDFQESIIFGYGMDNKTNYIKFSKNEMGKYYIRYAACHWGNNFWLELTED